MLAQGLMFQVSSRCLIFPGELCWLWDAQLQEAAHSCGTPTLANKAQPHKTLLINSWWSLQPSAFNQWQFVIPGANRRGSGTNRAPCWRWLRVVGRLPEGTRAPGAPTSAFAQKQQRPEPRAGFFQVSGKGRAFDKGGRELKTLCSAGSQI